MNFVEAEYWDLIESRSPRRKEGKSWSCLCCKDSGIVDDVALLFYTGELKDGLARDTTAPGKRCRRPGCYAANVFGDRLLEETNPDICQWLHESVSAGLKEQSPDRAAVIERINSWKPLAIERATVAEIAADDPILSEEAQQRQTAPRPPDASPVALSYEPMDGVTIDGFEVGDRVQCVFPAYYDKADRKNAASDYPWGQFGDIAGFRQDVGLGGRPKLRAIVRFESGEVRLLAGDMMENTNTDF